MECWTEPMSPAERVAIREEKAQWKLLDDVLAKARAAVDLHRAGYDLGAGGFDANALVTAMDELGVAVDACAVLDRQTT